MKAKPISIILLVLVLVGGGVWYLKREPIIAKIKTWRSDSHMKKATAAREEGDIEKARSLAMSAYLLRPGKLEALRLLINTEDPDGSTNYLRIATALFNHPGADADDLARSLDVYLSTRDYRLFWKSFSGLSGELKEHPEIKLRHAQYLVARGATDPALEMLKELPEDNRTRLLVASLQSMNPDEATRTAGQQRLASLISGNDAETAGKAFRVVSTMPPQQLVPQVLLPAVAAWLERLGDSASAGDHLVRATIDWVANGGRGKPEADAIVRAAVSKWSQSSPYVVSQWLLSRGYPDEALKIASGARSTGLHASLEESLFEIEVRSLVQNERWEEVAELLDNPPSSILPMRIVASRAVVAKKMGRQAESMSNWQEAKRLAQLDATHRNSFLELYQRAKAAREFELAADAMIEASKNRKGVLPSTQELTVMMVYLIENNRIEDLVVLTNQLFSRETFSPMLINNSLYLRELAGESVPDGLPVISRLVEDYPTVLNFQTTKLVVHANRGEWEEAFEIARGIAGSGDINKLAPVDLIIVAGAFRQAGQPIEIPREKLDERFRFLLGSEQAFFRKWFE